MPLIEHERNVIGTGPIRSCIADDTDSEDREWRLIWPNEKQGSPNAPVSNTALRLIAASPKIPSANVLPYVPGCRKLVIGLHSSGFVAGGAGGQPKPDGSALMAPCTWLAVSPTRSDSVPVFAQPAAPGKLTASEPVACTDVVFVHFRTITSRLLPLWMS